MVHNLGGGLVNVDGHWVERDALRIAEAVNDYDPNLRVKVLWDEFVSVDTPPFQIVETCKDGVERVAFTAWQLDERILERIYAADTRIHDVDALITKNNERAKKEQKQRYQEKREEAKDLISHIAASPKDTYTARIDGELKKFKA